MISIAKNCHPYLRQPIRFFSSIHSVQHHESSHNPPKAKFDLGTSAHHVLLLYKRLLRESVKLPTQVQRAFIKNKIRKDFRENKKLETDSDEQVLHIRLALTHLDDIRAKVLHYAAVKVRDDRISEKEHEQREKKEEENLIKEKEQKEYDKQWKSWE